MQCQVYLPSMQSVRIRFLCDIVPITRKTKKYFIDYVVLVNIKVTERIKSQAFLFRMTGMITLEDRLLLEVLISSVDPLSLVDLLS